MESSLRILHLEDDPDDAELIQNLLAAAGIECEVLLVDTRTEFERVLAEGGFELILSDYTLPGFNGLAALDLARGRCPEVPFIFVSGTLGEETAIDALKHGATDYVLKHRLPRLGPAVQRALRETRERAEREGRAQTLRGGTAAARARHRGLQCGHHHHRCPADGLPHHLRESRLCSNDRLHPGGADRA